MTYDTRAVDFFLGENTSFVQNEGQEAEISFLFQNARPDDPRMLSLLVDRYGSEILTLVQALLNLPHGDQALQTAAKVFAHAGANIRSFWGESSPRKWLFGLAVRFCWNSPGHPEKLAITNSAGNFAFNSAARSPEPNDELETSLWEAIDGLPERLRLVIILRYLYGLNLQEIAELLDEKPDQVELELFSARSRLHAFFPAGERLYFDLHRDRLRQIEDYRNGLVDHETAVGTGLVQHVSECEHCFAYADDLVECEETLVRTLRNRWPLAPLDPVQRASLEETARSVSSQPQSSPFSFLPLRQILWTGGFLLALTFLAGYLFRASLDQETSAFQPEPRAAQARDRQLVPATLPDPLEISAVNLLMPAEDVGDTGSNNYIVHLEPVLSANGSSVVFSSTGNFLLDSNPEENMDVYIYNLVDGSVERAAPEGNRFGRWRTSPGISEDGRWVVYGSNELEGVDQGVFDWSRTGIYLYDRESGATERIDVGLNGDAPDGDSYAPAISPDGRWITFWSTSGNLSSGVVGDCVQAGRNQPCMDAFIHERESRTTTRIAVGRPFGESFFIRERIRISADGRWIPMTIYRTDQIADEVGLINQAGAYLYDRQSETFVQIDLSSEGAEGDAISFAASVSADGRFAAFISRANNLVSGDSSRDKEIFVRDLVNGVTERITGRGEGVLAFEYPADNSIDLPGWGNMVGFSADGRYVTFLGSWEHATVGDSQDCRSMMRIGLCNGVFLYDRETGKAKEVTNPGSNRLYFFPDLSADGRWVTYVELMPSCDPVSDRPVCTEVWLYDRENEWTYPVTKGRYRLPESAQLPVENLDTGRGPVNSLAFSPPGQILATAKRNDTIRLWNAPNGVALGTMKSSSGAAVNSLRFSPDGRWLAAGLSDGRVDVWAVSDRTILYTLDGHPGPILQVAFFADGRLVARAVRAIWVWQLQNDTFKRTWEWEFEPGTVMGMAIAPHNDWIATAEADDLVWLRDAKSGEVLLRLSGHVEGLRRVAISPDASYLAAGWRGGQVDVWQVQTGQDGELLPWPAAYQKTLSHPDEILNLEFTPENNFLATVTGPGELRMWDVDSGISFRPFYPKNGYNGVLAFHGDRMAAGVSSGLEKGEVYLAYLWEGFSSTDQPSFFEQGETDGDLPAGSLPVYRSREPGQGYTYIGKEIIFEDLYQANQATTFEILAPTYLPPGFQFRLAQVFPTGAVSLHYDYFERPGSPPTASLVFLQHPDTPGFPGYTVGASARIQEVEVGGLPGEYVSGEWQAFTLGGTGPGRFVWQWDPRSASQHLRWSDGEQLYGISYRSLQSGGIEEQFIGKADLLEVAERAAPLDWPTSPDYRLSATIIRNEFGCLVSAVPGDGSVSSLILDNWDRSGECQLVFVDRNIQGLHLPFAGVDVDCDGRAERLEIQVLPAGRDSQPSFQVVLMELSATGRYQAAWETSIPDSGGDLFAQVEVRPSGACTQVFVLEVSSGGETYTQEFRMQGEGVQSDNAPEAGGLFENGHDALPP